ncbi:GNAT family N-acetyltransferase [Neobacillus sp. DY30]|uniref:GNAT family N-acetyltransferase n=1 Tax=Neobacillus sp. DY30 TaxID=3047871 RepID=UPI0024C03E77|nr:GNAT family N-acetyltransferase [Neobacillus sp. DY30]WHX98723.1 GNAT family N-acetyltransferase [Neobacillus sp. DY30]
MKIKAKTKRYKQTQYFKEDSDENLMTWEEIIAQDLRLRGAVKKDAKKAAELIHIAIGDIAEKLTGQTKIENIRETLADFFREENNRLSYQNTIVADVFGEVVGVVITYPGEVASQLDEPILKRLRMKRRNEMISLDKEADESDFYIDTVCVKERLRGNGIGSILLKEAEKTAIQKGYSRLSLNVAKDNPYAKKLYEQIGFKDEKEIKINEHLYDYMVKTV